MNYNFWGDEVDELEGNETKMEKKSIKIEISESKIIIDNLKTKNNLGYFRPYYSLTKSQFKKIVFPFSKIYKITKSNKVNQSTKI